MKCKDEACENEVTGKQVYCSGACRTRTSRTPSVTDASVTKPSVTSEVGQADRWQVLRDMNDATDKWITDNMKVVLEDMNDATDKLIADGMKAGQTVISENGIGIPPTVMTVTRPPCTPSQLTSSCLACKDKPTCSYLHNMNSAVPGDADYAGVI